MRTHGFSIIAATLGLLGVAAGAFGAHALKSILAADRLTVFDTAVRYHMIHALALLVAGEALHRSPNGFFRSAGWAFVLGIALFSGSLYAMSLSGVRWLGVVTPLGGLVLILGWGLLAGGYVTERSRRSVQKTL